jgi:putative endonuclease
VDGSRADRSEKGRRAEALAAEWLVRRGFVVLDRNHAIRQGEVDLVCDDAGVLVFVEVRSRATETFGSPLETVDGKKGRRVVAAATHWAAGHDALEREMRFDVVGVTFGEDGEPRFEHVRGAFDGSGGPGLFG